jgi:hypothetical protein
MTRETDHVARYIGALDGLIRHVGLAGKV